MRTKKLFALLIGGFLSLTAYSQDENLSIGIEIGAGMTNVYGSEFLDEYAMPRIGFTGGITGQYYFNRNLSLKSGFLFEQKGDRREYTLTDEQGNQLGQATSTTSFNFLVVPLLARYEAGNKIRFFINGGPYAALLLNHVEKTRAMGSSPLVARNPYDFRRVEFGLSAGLGAVFPVYDKIGLSLEVRHNRGLSDLFHADPALTGKLKTHSTNFMAGLVYRL